MYLFARYWCIQRLLTITALYKFSYLLTSLPPRPFTDEEFYVSPKNTLSCQLVLSSYNSCSKYQADADGSARRYLTPDQPSHCCCTRSWTPSVINRQRSQTSTGHVRCRPRCYNDRPIIIACLYRARRRFMCRGEILQVLRTRGSSTGKYLRSMGRWKPACKNICSIRSAVYNTGM